MADYYHTAREAKRAIKEVADANKKRREQRRELGLEDDQVEHPLNYLTIDGRACKLHRNTEQHAAVERGDGLLPWNGDTECMIDRFDARSLLDFYRDPPPSAHQRPKTPAEEKLQELLIFESYRDLIRLTAQGLSEGQGLKAARDENIEIRAQARVIATAAFRMQSHMAVASDVAAVTAGMGMYSKMGFQYGADAGGTGGVSSDSDSSGSDSDGEEDGGAGAPQSAEEARQDAEADRLDDIAERYGVSDFSYRLHKALEAEGEQSAAMVRRARKRSGRKAARERARRMRGQGLDPGGKPLVNDWRAPTIIGAPSTGAHKPARPGSASPTRSDDEDKKQPFWQRTMAGSAGIDRRAFEKDDNSILDALPNMDPALPGAQHFPAASALEHVRQQAEAAKRARERSRSRSRDRYRRRSPSIPGRHTSRSRSRSRDRHRHRSRSRDRHHAGGGYSRRSRSRSRSRDRDRDRGRGRSHSRDRGRERDHHRPQGGRSTGGGGGGPSAPATAGKAGGSSTGGAPPAAGETPQERLKRIMAAQLNKQAQKDTVATTQKKLQEEKERAMRDQIQRLARRPSPHRGRSRSPHYM